ncbi:ImmA/IrrE family metallo-endopeptidase [Janthinobacterium sp. UMAB-60]|uniref:ImmA/IrrE family metallo-endopeptidase n=1 Tax=Janthinobacterium sp. UMAB-60 TaxID=1365365 RepID=UPI001C57915D|nr:ImmA/IrrE family metallo-endopeptidase [Janthinobacterium sp. UMAB-60]
MNENKYLNEVFGDESIGATEKERAKTSNHRFVRSQVQIAYASPQAKGRIFTAVEVLEKFGLKILSKVAQEGAASLISDPSEPAATLKARRIELGLMPEELARSANVKTSDVINAETAGKLSKMRTLESIAQALALDEMLLGYQSNGGRDSDLGVRLREMSSHKDSKKPEANIFDGRTVLGLTEAAWVFSKQQDIVEMLGYKSSKRINFNIKHETKLEKLAYEAGYGLAKKTRKMLGLSLMDPIDSLRVLIEEVLEIPLVQQSLASEFSGATISNGNVRGIVVNENGTNSNVWVRRMTLSHELCHLLWDSEENLNKLQVDRYVDMERSVTDPKQDYVEMRANAFAIEFLLPHDAVKQMSAKFPDIRDLIEEAMVKFGVGAGAAKYHIHNVTKRVTSQVKNTTLPNPDLSWVARENLSIDYFPVESTPITRRGKFAWIVALACENKIITSDSAASFLCCKESEFIDGMKTIIELGSEVIAK